MCFNFFLNSLAYISNLHSFHVFIHSAMPVKFRKFLYEFMLFINKFQIIHNKKLYLLQNLLYMRKSIYYLFVLGISLFLQFYLSLHQSDVFNSCLISISHKYHCLPILCLLLQFFQLQVWEYCGCEICWYEKKNARYMRCCYYEGCSWIVE